MIAHKISIKLCNDDWYQIGKYLIVKQMMLFKAQKISSIEDEDTVNAVNKIIEDNPIHQSFIALITNHKLENSLASK